jgi:UDP-3-O-[3-hydroxymyristoyl] N-acetylglucosamine deacetylase/3-hydroxyacyl-[acyl-carrier-protein] dehydratase
LLDNGLIKGGDLNNAIVYVDKEILNLPWKILKKLWKGSD